jgi:AraC-like DNA-binding protein
MDLTYRWIMPRFQTHDAEVQQAVIGGRKAVRRYWLNFDFPRTAGPGGPIRSSRITDSWGHRPRLEQDPSWRRTLDWYSLVYVHRGAGIYYGADGERSIRAGDLIWLFPGIAHAYGPASSERWDEINIDFGGPAFDAWRGAGLLDPAEPIRHLEPITFWRARLEEFVGSVSRSHGRPTFRDTGKLVELIAQMAAEWESPSDKAASDWIKRAEARLDDLQAGLDIDYEALAAKFGLGEQAFRKKFKRLTGVTPAQYRSRRLIAAACHLLEETQESCRAISRRLGFESEFYFSRRFKQLVGICPKTYRLNAVASHPSRAPR